MNAHFRIQNKLSPKVEKIFGVIFGSLIDCLKKSLKPTKHIIIAFNKLSISSVESTTTVIVIGK